jgi:iron complex outermembrane receptor protein
LWSPTSRLSLSLDRWYINRRDLIWRFNAADILRNEFVPGFVGGSIERDPNPLTWLPGVPDSGPILSVAAPQLNLGGTVLRGYDLDASAHWRAGTLGRLSLDASLTYYDKLLWKLGRNDPYISGLGNFYIYESPRLRAQAVARWDYGGFSWFARYNYTGSWFYGEPTQVVNGATLSGPLTCYLSANSPLLAFLGRCYVEAFETWDAGFSWTVVRNLKLALTVRNVAGKAAPLDPISGTLGFNPTFHNPYGRYLQLAAAYKFR